MKRRTCGWLTVAGFTLLLGGTLGSFMTEPVNAQAAREPVIYLNQAWSQDDREWYYNFSQGATVLSYDIFLNLEVADRQELFRSDANSERYGLIPQPANPRTNPDALPINAGMEGCGDRRIRGRDLRDVPQLGASIPGQARPH